MKKESGITIISLVVTIIILIILAGISINLTIGEDGLITKAKQAKENIELAQIEEQVHLNELYSSLETELSGEIGYDAIAKLTELKKAIADYIEEAGGIKPEYTAETTTFGDSIKGIVKEVTKTATATENNITEGKTAYVNGNLINGKMKNFTQKNILSDNFEINNSNIYISIPEAGYYDSTSKIIIPSSSVQANRILVGSAGNTVDIKLIVENYTELSVNDFFISNLSASMEVMKGGPVYAVTSSVDNLLSYNSETGMLICKYVPYVGQYNHLSGSSNYDVYLIK